MKTMIAGIWYRISGVIGTMAATSVAVLLANTSAVQSLVTEHGLVLHRLQTQELSGDQFLVTAFTTILIVTLTLAPLYKARSRRILGVLSLTYRRLGIAGLALATIGYFDYTYRLPRITLIITIAILAVSLPVFFVTIRRRPNGSLERVLIVGDDLEEILTVQDALDTEPIGYVGPSRFRTDGGSLSQRWKRIGEEGHLGGLSRLTDVIPEYDADTAALAFEDTDRGEFFGVLASCHDHGVDALIHRERADGVLVSDHLGGDLVEIDIEPWDWQERVVKRCFDVSFAAGVLVALSPLLFVIATAVKLEDGDPVLYRQERTAELGRTFAVYKFRSMTMGEEDVAPGQEHERVTRVGSFLRKFHLDELPQLWSILMGEMSVVGPRAAWTDEEHLIEVQLDRWRQRWFVKPGLTGLAQINGVSSEQPAVKLRYDLEYIRRQSLRFDIAIVIRQLWIVALDAVETIQISLERSSRG